MPPRGARDELSGLGRLAGKVAGASSPLMDPHDLDPLVERVGDARYVLLGEASHGTSEFYTWRAALTMRLVREKGFDVVAVEGDWPDCERVDRYVRGRHGAAPTGYDALLAFRRWPTWMWANREVAELAEALREHNASVERRSRVGFHGLDVYSLWESMEAVSRYLEENDPDRLAAARGAWACFEPYAQDPQEYARATAWVPHTCEREVLDLLVAMRADPGGPLTAHEEEARFIAEQNALVARNAERYYRAMMGGGAESWNVRDRHMVETLERVLEHRGPASKAIVWAHNTHVGDARFTDMARAGMVNVGQLLREAHGEEDVLIVGFSSHRGSVIAGPSWGAPMRRMEVPAAREGSWEDALHQAGPDDRLLLLDAFAEDDDALEERGHRAIGVVYDPEVESWGNYVPTVLPRRYDALLHVDQSRALSPFHLHPRPGEVPETYPFGA